MCVSPVKISPDHEIFVYVHSLSLEKPRTFPSNNYLSIKGTEIRSLMTYFNESRASSLSVFLSSLFAGNKSWKTFEAILKKF